ncbi:MAG TPA: phage tail sheath subtilisin-like domain-containing protein, partial [Pyrinomonadaceae bacterium]|nr:phage tail sheath subtilisin-like domain-containing protein [Pyrinomonadaceae bacterium]
MPEYLHPGVYIEEIERGPRPIEGVPTSTAAIIGEAERGSTMPRLVTSYKDYQRWFGDVFHPTKFLPYAANGFFENGGKRAFVARLVGDGATTATTAFGGFIVRAAGPGLWGTRVRVKISDSTTRDAADVPVGFRLQLAYWSGPIPDFDPFVDRTTLPRPALTEDFDDLVTDESSPDYYGKRFPFIDLEKGETNQGPESSALGILVRTVGVPPGTRPDNGLNTLAGGADDAAALGVDDYRGLAIPGVRGAQGLAALELDRFRDVALVYAPNVSADIARSIVAHCERLRFRFAVIDSDKGQDPGALNPRNTITDSHYAGFYYPWLVTADPRTGARKLVPPGGHVLGVYARSDTERGVFKAPANEIVRGALDLENEINDEVQDSLNPKGVNVIRSFPGR